ncbi:MAG: hypothetical protein ACRD1X_22475 [Vicinamibacteria bacterium]
MMKRKAWLALGALTLSVCAEDPSPSGPQQENASAYWTIPGGTMF